MQFVVYSSESGVTYREVFLTKYWFVRKARQILKIFGAGIFLFGVTLFMFSYGEILSQEAFYWLSDLGGDGGKRVLLASEKREADNADAEIERHDLTSYFSIVIPKIGATANIIPNVDANNPDEYLSALQKGVAHVKGSFFPGQSGRIFLFSHSTDSPANFSRYNAIFYLLRRMESGDKIIVYFAGKKYLYEVTDKVIVEASDTSWLESRSDLEELILMTCDPPGTTLRRLLIISKPLAGA
jgi:LPXTG-site transpeptidase (sortase) family protein